LRTLLTKLTYANVVATLALFLALGGGAVWAAGQLGKNVVTSKNIAANAVRTKDIAKNAVKAAKIGAGAVHEKNLAKNAVSAAKVKKGTLTRTQLKTGTLAGLQVADAQAANVPGLSGPLAGLPGTPIPLTGTTTFVPQAGKSYELLAELRGNPSDADGGGEEECFAFLRIFVNGEPVGLLLIGATAGAPSPFDLNPVDSLSAPVALQAPGVPQTIAANTIGSNGCGAETTGNLRIVVVEFG
jgi:hypothetical protein